MFNKRRGAIALTAVVAAVSLFAAPVYGGKLQGRSNRIQLAQAEISADRAADIARSATGGRVLKVKRQGSVYVVRVLLDGERVRNVSVDAQTGRVLD